MKTRHKITVGTKAQADRLLIDSLFSPSGTLNSERLDMGKYRADLSPVGKEVEVCSDVAAVWFERRKDSDGAYLAAFCLSRRAANQTSAGKGGSQ